MNAEQIWQAHGEEGKHGDPKHHAIALLGAYRRHWPDPSQNSPPHLGTYNLLLGDGNEAIRVPSQCLRKR